jgi:DNA repair protein SbcD/Mre11
MPELRIAHISDTHLGYRQFFRTDADGRNLRSIDIEDAYRAVVDDVIRHGEVDLIVHTGDVFHQSRPSWAAVRCFIEHTRRLEAIGVPIIVIAGNHDTPQLRTPSTVFSVLELSLPKVQFVSGYLEKSIDLESLGLNVVAVPHGRLISGPLSAAPLHPDRRNILITHGLAPTLAESPRHEIGEMLLDEKLLATGFDAILLGHFHKRMQVNRTTWYAGSSDRIGWNDEQTRPGWAVVTLADGADPEQFERPITTRQMITLDPVDGTGRTAREIVDNVLDTASRFAQPDSMVRIELLNVERAVRRSVESILRRDPANRYLHLQVYSRQDNTALFDDEVTIDESLKMKGIRDLFADFCAEQPYDEEFRARFLARGQDAIERAIRAAEVTAGDAE